MEMQEWWGLEFWHLLQCSRRIPAVFRAQGVFDTYFPFIYVLNYTDGPPFCPCGIQSGGPWEVPRRSLGQNLTCGSWAPSHAFSSDLVPEGHLEGRNLLGLGGSYRKGF